MRPAALRFISAEEIAMTGNVALRPCVTVAAPPYVAKAAIPCVLAATIRRINCFTALEPLFYEETERFPLDVHQNRRILQ